MICDCYKKYAILFQLYIEERIKKP